MQQNPERYDNDGRQSGSSSSGTDVQGAAMFVSIWRYIFNWNTIISLITGIIAGVKVFLIARRNFEEY